eukprot:g8672.t1
MGGWFDPFLTSHGHVQASRAGLYLKSLPFTQQPGTFDVVYTSPLVRAVQTAVCVSQGLGNLPLQVVPGLCSCTTALERIGYANAQNLLMTDAEITRTFPGVTVIPRDPLAPTSFSGAAAWLASKVSEKKGADDDEDGGGDGCGCARVSRVLAVGHREGTKAMAGRRVPTPHCCIGIFRTEASDNTHRYTLHDLLSHKGESLKPGEESASLYARPTAATRGEDNGPRNDASSFDGGDRAVERLAARVMALTIIDGVSTFAGFLGVPGDTLCGESGVLSFLSALELCTAQATCTPIAAAAADESLWRKLYSRLPRHLRDRNESGLSGTEKTPLHPKALFASAISTASSAHAAKMAQKVAFVRRRLATIHNLRSSVRSMKVDLRVRLNDEPVGVVQTTGAKNEAWVSRSSLLSEPSVNGNDGARAFSLSSSLKVEVPASLETVQQLRSMCVSLSWPDKETALLPRMPVFRIDSWPAISQARLLGKSAEGAVVLFGVAGSSSSCSSNDGGANRSSARRSGDVDGDRAISYPASVLRGCALLGMLPSRPQDGQRDADAGGFAFLTVHLPHDLVLDVATRRNWTRGSFRESVGNDSRRRQSYGDDSAGPRHGLENFASALGLRTAGVPLWETASMGIGGCIRMPRDVVSRLDTHTSTGVGVVCFDLLRPGANGGGSVTMTSEERTLSAGPGLPFSTPGGLSGVVADVLLADFTLCHDDGVPLWAFTSPIVFEACLDAAAAEAECDSTIDMAHKEVTEERQRGIVAEQGVGRVVVELGLVESPGENDGHDGRARSAASRARCPVGHVWIVVSARAELDLDFINAWFGTKHGRA